MAGSGDSCLANAQHDLKDGQVLHVDGLSVVLPLVQDVIPAAVQLCERDAQLQRALPLSNIHLRKLPSLLTHLLCRQARDVPIDASVIGLTAEFTDARTFA